MPVRTVYITDDDSQFQTPEAAELYEFIQLIPGCYADKYLTRTIAEAISEKYEKMEVIEEV